MSTQPVSYADSSVDLDRFGVTPVQGQVRGAWRVAVIATRFNAPVVDRLVEGALATLLEQGVTADRISLVRVPGAWELPVAAVAIARSEAVDAIIALGCVIRGETSHYDVIVESSARGLQQVAIETGIPIANGVLACENEAQARARAGGDAGNKGTEAALAALEMADLVAMLV